MDAPITSRHQRRSFSLQTLIVVVTFFALYFGAWRVTLEHAGDDVYPSRSPAPFVVVATRPKSGTEQTITCYFWLPGKLKRFWQFDEPFDGLEQQVAAQKALVLQLQMKLQQAENQLASQQRPRRGQPPMQEKLTQLQQDLLSEGNNDGEPSETSLQSGE